MKRRNKKNRNTQRAQQRLHQVESLEDRRLMAANVTFHNSILSIYGDSTDDHVVVEQEMKRVTVPSQQRRFFRIPRSRQRNVLTTTVVQKERNSAGLFAESSRESFFGRVREIKFFGRNGNDYFQNNTNVPTVAYGGRGYDRIYGGTAADTLNGGSESDFLSGGSGNDRLNGGHGNDAIHGGPGADLLRGDEGNDRLFGYSGDDTVFGGNGKDRLYGGSGDDRLFGDDGNDLLRGGSGADELFGQNGSDELLGQGGRDLLKGGSGRDVLRGGSGNDRLYGGSGRDVLRGNSGNDGLFGGAGLDHMVGGNGADRFLLRKHHDDTHGNIEGIDAAVYFQGIGSDSLDGDTFSTGRWTDAEIETVDGALDVLHRRTGTTKLLKDSDGRSMTYRRVGNCGCTTNGFNRSGPTLTLTDGAFSGNAEWTHRVVFHEVGHNWDSPNIVGNAWLDLSGWVRKGDPITDLWYTFVAPNEKRTSEDSDWWYDRDAHFAREDDYGQTNPREDFATCFAAYFMNEAGEDYPLATNSMSNSDLMNHLSDKVDFVDDLVEQLS